MVTAPRRYSLGAQLGIVQREPSSPVQLRTYVPQSLGYGLGIPEDSVKVDHLEKLPMAKYNATSAVVWIPKELVGKYAQGVEDGSSKFYSPTNASARILMSLVNRTQSSSASATASASDGSIVDFNLMHICTVAAALVIASVVL